eukprot:TRINITY_DN56691_c0_g1_i1.p1 TRINITY_DN56691_c0_g1~~TRINITY_DN56691_c0_g1_i1.p1  ORF type:complete len:435 (-),score=84.98 TRINITY_DN56691_c0_g1_i1:87-1310(-)
MVSQMMLGMLALICEGFLDTALVTCSRLMKSQGWPFFRVNSVSSSIATIGLLIAAIVMKEPIIERSRRFKWIVLRGVFGVLYFILSALAVQLGASPGDVAALSSINGVMAAVMGRFFLGERLRRVHGAALLCSAVGAVLISEPKFLFGSSGGGRQVGAGVYFGYVAAVAAGLSSASIAISARKAGDVSMWILTLSPTVLGAIFFFLLPFTPLIDEDLSLDFYKTKPLPVAGSVLVMLVCNTLAMTTSSIGNSWCPAAISSTTGTAARMVWGYAAQILLLHEQPRLVTLSGAACMFVGVVVMATVRTPDKRVIDGSSVAVRDEVTSGVTEANEAADEIGDIVKAASGNTSVIAGSNSDEVESLASFIASEFAERTPRHPRPPRLRKSASLTHTCAAGRERGNSAMENA